MEIFHKPSATFKNNMVKFTWEDNKLYFRPEVQGQPHDGRYGRFFDLTKTKKIMIRILQHGEYGTVPRSKCLVLFLSRGSNRAPYTVHTLLPETNDDFNQLHYWLLASAIKHSRVFNIDSSDTDRISGRQRKKIQARSNIRKFEMLHQLFFNTQYFNTPAEEGEYDAESLTHKRLKEVHRQRPEADHGDYFLEGDVTDLKLVKRSLKRISGDGTGGQVFAVERYIPGISRWVSQCRRRSGQVVPAHWRGVEPCIIKFSNLDIESPDKIQALKDLYVEARVLAAFGNHPNIIKLLDTYASTDNRIVLFLENGGPDLKSLSKTVTLNNYRIWSIVNGILKGLSHMHQSGIYHLDIKPENILVSENRIAKLIDFGKSRAKFISKNIFNAHWKLYGTTGYIPPESFEANQSYTKGKHLEKRDSYAVGMTILGFLIGPRYGWQHDPPVAQTETQERIYQRIDNWMQTIDENREALMNDGLWEYALLAMWLIHTPHPQEVRGGKKIFDPRWSITEAYEFFKRIKPPLPSRAPKPPLRTSRLTRTKPPLPHRRPPVPPRTSRLTTNRRELPPLPPRTSHPTRISQPSSPGRGS